MLSLRLQLQTPVKICIVVLPQSVGQVCVIQMQAGIVLTYLWLCFSFQKNYTFSGSPCRRLVGLVVRRPPRERKVPGSNPTCAGIFSGSSHTSDLNIGTPVATLPGTWRYRVSAGTGRPGVSIL